jgi:CO/xanthine dehydrogenase FAD-binding subunit
MYPRPFAYERAASLADALSALAGDQDAKPIAGGQSLVPMMSLGLLTPARIVDIGGLDLTGLQRANGTITVGALTRHRELERSDEFARHLPLAAEAARHIGNPRVRNRGTLGGSLSHADPAAELGAVMVAQGGHAVIAGVDGARRVAFDEFFQGFFETAVGPDELLVSVELDTPPDGSGTAFVEIARRADDFALAAAAAIVTPGGSGGEIARIRLALAGVADRPVRCVDAEDLCKSNRMSDQLLDALGQAVQRTIEPEDDAFTSAAYRSHLAATCAVRAVRTAWRRAQERSQT